MAQLDKSGAFKDILGRGVDIYDVMHRIWFECGRSTGDLVCDLAEGDWLPTQLGMEKEDFLLHGKSIGFSKDELMMIEEALHEAGKQLMKVKLCG